MTRQKTKRKGAKHRSWHRKLVLHPASLFMLLCVGILLIAATIQTLALTYSVAAKVPAPPITEPAVVQIVTPVVTTEPVTEPVQAAVVQDAKTAETAVHVPTKQITLSGECPKNSHLTFYRNGELAGVVPCIGDPTFSIQLDLVPGLNVIVAHVFNFTEDEGPVAQPIYIHCDANYTAINEAGSTTNNTELSPFILTPIYRYLGFPVDQKGTWDILATGGKTPYALTVDWGDGSTSAYTINYSGKVTLSHTYKKSSSGVGFPITVQAKDNGGQTADLNMMSIISAAGSHQAGLISQANNNLNPSLFTKTQKWLWLEWPAYLVLVLMVASYWLGEREEYKHLMGRRIHRRHA